jgi:hypothetical protein
MPVMLVEIPESMNEYFKKIVPSGAEMIVRSINDNVLEEKLDGCDIVITFDKDAEIASKQLCERALRFPHIGFIYYSQVSLDKNKEHSVENLLLQTINGLNFKDSSQITTLLNKGLFFLETLKHFRLCNRNLQERLTELNKIGIALSSERNLDKLLDMILREVRKFTRSDAGSLYIKDG